MSIPENPWNPRRVLRWSLPALVLLALLFWGALRLLFTPSVEGDWIPEQARLAEIRFEEDGVWIGGIRDFLWESRTSFTEGYTERFVADEDVREVDLVVEPFSSFKGAAHVFLSFGLADGERVAFSVEARREEGQSWGVLRGLLRQYPLVVIIGTERDLIGLRANHRQNDVYVYPVEATRKQVLALFHQMLRRADTLTREPEFYHTLFNNCAGNITREVNELFPGRIPFHTTLFFPEKLDRYARELGLLAVEEEFPEMREAHRINEAAAHAAHSDAFTRMIREREMN